MLTKFYLNNFEGPLELLLHLVQNEEVDIRTIPVKELTNQFFSILNSLRELDVGAELLGLVATLLALKSRKLLPNEADSTDQGDEEEIRFQIFQKLIEYCRIKETAKVLATREAKENVFFPRAPAQIKKSEARDGLEEIGIEEFKKLFSSLLERIKGQIPQMIQGEVWQVIPLLEIIKNKINESTIEFYSLFSPEKCREELIVTFLAVLELMKQQVLKIVKEENYIYIIPYDSNQTNS